jgi:glycosyltransferase involved in cell wall biosynthesis
VHEVAFVIEQVLGHITHGKNLREHVQGDSEVHPHWILPPYEVTGWPGRLPVYGSNWTVRSGIAARRGLRAINRTARLDALFFHTQVPAMLCPDWLRRVPSVISLDATPRQYDELGGVYQHDVQIGLLEDVKHRATRARLSAAQHLVTWSEWAKQGVVADYCIADDRITVVPPGVRIETWARASPRPVSDTTRLLFVGGDLERKGGRLLLEAFRALRHLDVELDVVTRDELAPEPGVTVHQGLEPNGPELRRLYHDCDVFVLPTLGDTLGIVLAEAGAASMATVSTRVGAIPEVVVDGVTGILVPPGDVPALGAALERLITKPDERRRMGERAHEHIARHHDTATNSRALLEILKRIGTVRPS